MITTVGHLKEILNLHSDEDEIFMQTISSENSIYTISPANSRIAMVMILHKNIDASRIDIYVKPPSEYIAPDAGKKITD